MLLHLQWLRGPAAPQEVEVKSVDGYQGREKDIILLSTVRANPRHVVGFLSDWRRMNVALTRARKAIIVLGNTGTLATDPHWQEYIRWVEVYVEWRCSMVVKA